MIHTATRIATRTFAAAAVTAFAVSAAYAQQQPQQKQQQTQRLAGTIERVDGSTVFAKGRDGAPVTLKLADNVVVTAVLNATVADIKPGAYIGSGATRCRRPTAARRRSRCTSLPNRCVARAMAIVRDGMAHPMAP
jgi:hypothetical protein